MSAVSRMFVCLAALATMGLQAAEDLALQYDNRSAAQMDLPIQGNPAFWDRFKFAFDQSADEVFSDRFHPLNMMNRNFQMADRDARQIRERTTGIAGDAFSKSVTYGIREAVVDTGFMTWIREHQGLLGNFLWNTVDDVGEESVAPLNPAYGRIERSWWGRLSDSDRISIGIRPLREDPYAFFSFNVRDGDQLHLLGHVRYRFRDFTDHRFEFALSVPMARGVSLDVGTSYQFGQNDEKKALVMKLAREFKSGGIMHLGLEVKDRPSLFAGVSLPL